jgi:hypothetical protein
MAAPTSTSRPAGPRRPPRPAAVCSSDSGGAWQLRESDGEFVFTFRSSIGGPAPYKIARFNRAFTGRRRPAGSAPLSDGHLSDAAYPLQYPLDELVMIHLLSQGKGVEIHGCGVLDRAGRAYLFVGQSGAGKSDAGAALGRPRRRRLAAER